MRRLPGWAGRLAPALLLLPLAASADAPTFTGIGDLPGGTVDSVALAISADGSVVVGQSESGGGTQAFRWTAGGGISALGFLSLADPHSIARAISADGAVIAGSSNGSDGVRRAFRWSAGVFTALNRLTCSNCDPVTEGFALSGDGLVVAGSAVAKTAVGPLHVDPVRWPGGGTALFDLGNLTATQEVGEAYGASDTGALIAGAHNSTAGRDAWYWTGSGLSVLPRLSASTPVTAGALAVARDGSAIVGYSTKRTVTLPGGTIVPVEPQAVRWSGAGFTVLENLGTLPGATTIDSRANAVSPDGTVAVGRAKNASGADAAFVWDAAHGMRDLAAVLGNDFGLDLTGWSLREALGVSEVVAGRFTVIGRGVNPSGQPEGWVAQLGWPACEDGIDNDGDGAVDFPQDTGCTSGSDDTEQLDCADGIDNDGDGAIDYPADSGCTSASDPTEQLDCEDGVDNDGDGLVDYPADPGCASAQSPIENPQCSNGIDDDGDGASDYPADAQCVSASDASELPDCSDGLDNDGDAATDFPADPQCVSNADLSEHPQCSDGLDNDSDGVIDYPGEYPNCVSAEDAIEAPQCGDGVDNDGDGQTDFPADTSCGSVAGASESRFVATSPGLLVVDRTSRALFFVNASTGAQQLISEKAWMQAPQGVATRGNEFLVADPAGLIAVVASGAQRVASPPLEPNESLQIELDAGGLPTVLEADRITKITGSESGVGTKSTWLALPVLPTLTAWEGDSLAREASGDWVTTAIGFLGNGVFRIDGDTTDPSILDPNFKALAWRDLAVESSGAILAVGSLDAATGVFRVDSSSGLATPLDTSFGWQRPTAVAVDANGMIYVADAGSCNGAVCTGGKIAKVDPVSGAATQLATGGSIAGEMDLVALPEPGAAARWVALLALAALARRRRAAARA